MRVDRMTMLFLGDFFDRDHFTAIHPSHLFFMMLDFEVRGGGDELVGDFLGGLVAHLSVVPYYKLADVTIKKG